MTMSNVSVLVMDDKLAEWNDEMFDLMLTIPSALGPTITAGSRNRAIGVIVDTTGKHIYQHSSVLQILFCAHASKLSSQMNSSLLVTYNYVYVCIYYSLKQFCCF